MPEIEPMSLVGLEAFNREVQEFTRDMVPKQLLAFHQKIGLQALEGVVTKTPVDTSRARENWQVSITEPQDTVLPITIGSLPGSGSSGDAQIVAAGKAVIDTLQPFGVIYITNNVSYVIYLEGPPLSDIPPHSKQAPQGMLMLTLAEIQAQFP